MMQGHHERVFGQHEQTDHILQAVFNNNIINPKKRKMHLKFQGQEFLLQIQNLSTTRSLLMLLVPLSSFTSQIEQAD